MAKKSCKKGYYYCYASKKCKKIPMGYVVGMGGWLRKEKEDDETEGKKKNGNGNGANGDGSGSGDSNGGSNGGGVSEGWSAKYKKSINCDNPKGFSQRAHCQGKKKVTEGKEGDHEVSMAKSQLKKSAENIAKLRKVLKKKTDKDNLPAWVQAKITDTEHNTDAAAGYMEEGKRDGKSAKDKGYSLRDWFKGGGWVQAGGKYDGKPCAKQPGQKTKPFCRDADDRANMSKKERSRRAAKKRREDPNPNRKGKAKMVTDNYSNWREDLKQLDEFMGLFGPKTVTPKDSPTGTKSVKVGKKYPARLDRKPVDVTYDKQGNKTVTPMSRGRAGLMQYKYGSTWGMPQYNSYEPEGQVVEGRYSGGGGLRPTDRIKMGDGSLKSLKDIDAKLKEKGTKKEEFVNEEGKSPFSTPGLDRKNKIKNWQKNADKVLRPQQPIQLDKAHFEPEGELVDEGKKDACYHKVKSRYSVWPSAYASGALVKCRKVGAKNWGNKTKKEGYEFSNWRDDFQAMEFESIDIIKAEPLKPTDGIGSRMLGEAKKCWKGYKKVGTQKLFGKTYNRCEKIKEDWQKSNRNDGVDGMSQKSVDAYKRENPGSNLKTAVTGKVKKGSKDAKRRKSFCARSKGQKDMHNIDCSKTPEKKICKARKRWRC